jgi:hypothetical protein
MSRTKMNGQVDSTMDRARQLTERVKPMAAQAKPLAVSTRETAKRGVLKTRAWAAPQLERTGQVLQDSVAPKVSSLMSSAAKRIEPAKPARRQWGKLVGLGASLLAAVAAAGAAAVLRGRKQSDTSPDDVDGEPSSDQ